MFAPDLIVIDGPNFYNVLVRSLAPFFDQKLLGEYVRTWLDFDRVIAATLGQGTGASLGTVVFHSGKQLGSDRNVRLENQEVNTFWARQGSNPFCSTEAVVLPGTQEEIIEGICGSCGKQTSLREKREKGVDTAITTYLWETSERYGSVCLVSGDADFVPPTRSLKRRGKRVYCIVEPGSARRDLVQVCTSHVEINLRFVHQDCMMLQALKPGGAIDEQLAELTTRFGSCGVDLSAGPIQLHSGLEFTVGLSPPPFPPPFPNDLKVAVETRFGPLGWALSLDETSIQGASDRKYTLRLYHGRPGLRFYQDPNLVEGALRHLDAIGTAAWLTNLKT